MNGDKKITQTQSLDSIQASIDSTFGSLQELITSSESLRGLVELLEQNGKANAEQIQTLKQINTAILAEIEDLSTALLQLIAQYNRLLRERI